MNKNTSVNIYDIAEMAHVSIATVSRVVNGSDKVSEKTRAKVIAVIDKVGYTPNVFAQGLGLNTMHTVGILVPTIADLYMSNAVFHLQHNLARYGYDCILSCSGFDIEGKQSQVEMLLSKHIDSLIMVGSTYAGSGVNIHDTDYIRDAAEQVPVFVINGEVSGENVYSAVCDDRAIVYEVTTELIKTDCTRILFLTDSHSYSANQKLNGYETALIDSGLPVLGELKMYVKNRVHAVRDTLLQYHNLDFDAVIATDDTIAVGAVKYATEKGLRMPQDLSIVGYNNLPMSIACEPELTSIDNHTEQICRDVVDHVIDILEHKETDVLKEVIIPCHLVKRGTTRF